MSKEFLDRKLDSVGKESFANFYWDYKNLYLKSEVNECTKKDKDKLAEKLLNENPKADSLRAQITRVNSALKIFENKLHIRALENVIDSKSAKVTIETKNKAKFILEKEKNNETN